MEKLYKLEVENFFPREVILLNSVGLNRRILAGVVRQGGLSS